MTQIQARIQARNIRLMKSGEEGGMLYLPMRLLENDPSIKGIINVPFQYDEKGKIVHFGLPEGKLLEYFYGEAKLHLPEPVIVRVSLNEQDVTHMSSEAVMNIENATRTFNAQLSLENSLNKKLGKIR